MANGNGEHTKDEIEAGGLDEVKEFHQEAATKAKTELARHQRILASLAEFEGEVQRVRGTRRRPA